jgi:hypothetical protein
MLGFPLDPTGRRRALGENVMNTHGLIAFVGAALLLLILRMARRA